MSKWLLRSLAFVLLISAGRAFADDKPKPTSTPSRTPTPIFDKFTKDFSNRIKIEHDKFKNLTKISLDPHWIDRETMNFHDTFLSPGQLLFKDDKKHTTDIGINMVILIPDAGSEQAEPTIGLFFDSRTNAWEHLDDHEFNWLVDGKPLKWVSDDYEHVITGDGGKGVNVRETITLSLSPAQLKKLVAAKEIDCRFGSTEFLFGDLHRWILYILDKKMDEILHPKEAPAATKTTK